MSISSRGGRRRTWLTGVSGIAVGAALGSALLAAPAGAQQAPEGVWNSSFIVPRADLSNSLPPPAGVLDLGITGVGQVITDAGGGSIGTCTGTLVNPRMVLFAAHCVNTRAASDYGGNQGGTGIGVFFQDFTLPGIRQWLGIDPGPGRFVSNPGEAYFNVNQVWYDPRSLDLGPSLNFIHADVAIATLDAHAGGIPTWAMLFSPLTGETHAQLIGYGSTGNATSAVVSGGFRRRAVENMLSVLGSLDDRNDFLFGPDDPEFFQSLYMTDFDDPRRGTGTESQFDFDIFKGNALPREGTTAPGDSGGPLVVDQLFDRNLVVGVLSGGSRFFAAQPFSTYGTHNFYQPLFLFWDKIVQNNPYVYATARAGNGDWFDPRHWVQDMDPNYHVVRNGRLVNDLPDTPALGVSGDTVKFGHICFFDDCIDLADESAAYPRGNGRGLVIAGGPGSTGFVPNNVEPDRLTGTQARYFDVTLNRLGTTRLSRAATIDKLTIDGLARLDIRSGGDLRVLADFTQLSGWTNVDGRLRTGEALMVSGLLTGSGTFRAPWLTLGKVAVAPGGADDVGTLTVQGNLVMSSGTSLFIDARRGAADQLRVIADGAGTGQADLAGALVFNKAKGAAPRHGESYTIVSAEGGIDGRFDKVYSFQGVLRPTLDYGNNTVVAHLRAGSLVELLQGANPLQLAFAKILDRLRDSSYTNLYSLYGEMDWLDGRALGGLFNNMAPTGMTGALSLFEMQGSGFADLFSGRLSALSSPGGAQGLAVLGDVARVMEVNSAGWGGHGRSRTLAPSQAGFTSGGTMGTAPLPEGMSGFISGGTVERGRSAMVGQAAMTADQGERSWHMAMGLERQATSRLTLGFATAFASGESAFGIDSHNTAVTTSLQSAFYGAYRFDGGAYVAALASAGTVSADSRRQFGVGDLPYDVTGRIGGNTVTSMLETGLTYEVADGLTLNPKMGLRHNMLHTRAFDELGGDAALRIEARTLSRLEGRVGLGFTGMLESQSGWTFAPQLEASYVRNLSGQDADLRVRFTAVEMEAFALPAAFRDRGWGEVRGGIRMERDGLSFGVDLSTDLGRAGLHEDRARASVGYRF